MEARSPWCVEKWSKRDVRRLDVQSRPWSVQVARTRWKAEVTWLLVTQNSRRRRCRAGIVKSLAGELWTLPIGPLQKFPIVGYCRLVINSIVNILPQRSSPYDRAVEERFRIGQESDHHREDLAGYKVVGWTKMMLTSFCDKIVMCMFQNRAVEIATRL